MHGKQMWNKGSGQEYNNVILKGRSSFLLLRLRGSITCRKLWTFKDAAVNYMLCSVYSFNRDDADYVKMEKF